jgi:Ca2+ transporting ATPase
LFCGILFATIVLQILIVSFGREAFHVAEDGLSQRMWIISIAIGAGSLPMQQVINVVYLAGLKYKGYRTTKRRKRDGGLNLRNTSGNVRNTNGMAKPHRE